MSDRLVKEWTPNSEGAFGKKGKIGDVGEQMAIELLTSFGLNVIHHPDDKRLQISGVDMTIMSDDDDRSYGIDVKTNIHKDKDVCVDYKKIHNSASTYWLHININDPDDWIMYPVAKMVEHVKELKPYNDEYYWVPRKVANNLK